MANKSLPRKITKSERLWFTQKTILKVTVVRPTEEEREQYEFGALLGPMALKFYFTDGTTAILDSWVGEFKLKRSKISGVQNSRQRSYLTISRKEKP